MTWQPLGILDGARGGDAAFVALSICRLRAVCSWAASAGRFRALRLSSFRHARSYLLSRRSSDLVLYLLPRLARRPDGGTMSHGVMFGIWIVRLASSADRRLRGALDWRSRHAVVIIVSSLRALLAVTVPVHRPDFFRRRCGTAATPREGSAGRDRRDRKVLPERRGLYPPGHPRQRDRRDRRQHRRRTRSTWRSATVSRSERPMANLVALKQPHRPTPSTESLPSSCRTGSRSEVFAQPPTS